MTIIMKLLEDIFRENRENQLGKARGRCYTLPFVQGTETDRYFAFSFNRHPVLLWLMSR